MASTTVQDIPDRLAPAYRECIALARSHYENFTVAGRFLPKRLLPHVAAIYAYCRGVDDLGDEAAGDRLALLDAWEADLEQAYAGTPTAPHLQALQHTIRAFAIPPEPFRKLITANRMDQTQSRYATFADVLHYCEHSANPVGFLYLLLFGYDDERAQAAVGRYVHGAAASQLLAGRPPRLGQGPRLPAAGGHGALRLHGRAACRGRLQPGLSRSYGLGGRTGARALRAGAAARGVAGRHRAAARQALQPWRHASAGRHPGARLRCPLKAAGGLRTPQGMALGEDVPQHETHTPDLVGAQEVERGMAQATVLEEAYAHCQRVTKAEAKNFYYAFVTLPKAKRQAIYAVYAFCRLCDDIADEPLPVDEKRRKLREVDVALEHARDGNPDGPVYSALAHAVREYGIPWEDLSEVARGVEMDLTLSRYETFDDLATYCYRVASVVGIICIHIFGFTDPVAREYAVDLGLGMQLTNILRDIKEDAEMDRVYLPQEELRRFGYPEEALMAGETSDEFTRLMRFQVARARGYFDSGKRLLPLLPVRSRACPAVLGGLYSRVLDRIEQRDYDVFERRVSLPTREKLFLAVRLWLQSYVPLKGVAAAW